jgi:hypothetical protein
MRRRLVHWILTVPLILVGVSPGSAQDVAGEEPAGAGLPHFRPAGAVAVLARATGDWLPVPTDSHDLLGSFAFLPPYATDDTQGQLFQVLAVEAGREAGDEDGTFVAVPWTVGCGCADEGWDQPDWVPPGDTVAFILSVTRKRVPWSGPPVFDVLGWHQPYPSGDFIPYWKPGREGPERWLSSADFFDLLQTLPDETSFRLDPSTALRAVRSWVDRNPDAAEAFPVPTLTEKLEEMSEGWEPEGLSPL